MWKTGTLALFLTAAAGLAHDGWTTSAAGCPATGYDDTTSSAWSVTASACAELSQRQNSSGAAMRAAIIYAYRSNPQGVREVLTPFEASEDPIVLYTLAWADSLLLKRDLASQEYRRAFLAADRVMDVRVRANATTLFSYELFTAAQYEEAVRILDRLLRETAGALPILYERDARLNLARSLDAMGDAPAAEAELGHLRAVLGTLPLNHFELDEDAQLHIQRGQLHSADMLLEQAQAAARQESSPIYEAEAAIDRIEVAVKQGDWAEVRALLAEIHPLDDSLSPDDRRGLAFLKGLDARAEGRFEESRDLLEQALALSPTPDQRWRFEYESGLTLMALGQLGDARKAFEESISQIELQRKQLINPGLQAALVGSREKPYDALFELYAEMGDATRALSTLQKSFARRLDDDITQVASTTGVSVGDALQRSTARRALDDASRRLVRPEGEATQTGSAFIAFVTTERHAWAVMHSAGRTRLEQIQLSPKDLCALMQRFSEDLDDNTAAQLGSALFPSTTLAQLGPRFAISLPACARSFPVAAVRVGAGRLVDTAVVSIAPDASAARSPLKRSPGELSAARLVLADPVGDLPSARQEAEWTGRFTDADVRLGERASGASLGPSGGQLLHFATHTVVDVAGPALVLSDSKLSVADILSRRLHADLVVLASCHSGSRLEATAAETLATAFLRTGSEAVLATWRSVEDEFASQVVRAFYEDGGLEDPAGALARVQRRLARTEPVGRWSAFFVAGSPEALRPPASPLRRAQAFGG